MSALGRVDRFLASRSRNLVLVGCLLLALAIGAIDYYTHADVLIVYLAPIFLAAWYGGSRVGMVISIYCTGAWFLDEAIRAGNNGVIVSVSSVWTLVARLTMFLVMTQIVSKLRRTTRQQVELTNFIVHDLRSPIASAISGLQTLQQNTTRVDDEEKEMVELALISNQRALDLVNSILDVSKLENGKMEVHVEDVDVRTIVSESISHVALWARGNSVHIASSIEIDHACFDPSLISRVIVNLLSNALKFSPPDSVVRVNVIRSGRDGVHFSIVDQGPGIPSEYAETIFEPFSQVKGTKGGTGLGLTFCRLAVQAQGGRIWVETALSKGTTMHFSLPFAARLEKGHRSLAEPEHP